MFAILCHTVLTPAVRCGALPCGVTQFSVAGVDESSMLRLNGQGDVGMYGGGRGDLHLKFLVSQQEIVFASPFCYVVHVISHA